MMIMDIKRKKVTIMVMGIRKKLNMMIMDMVMESLIPISG